MAEKLEEELDQLTDEEIEARLAAAVWVDDKRAAVLRYLEEKKLGKKKEARSAEFAIARNAKEAAWAAASLAKEANWRANLAITIASVAAAAASQQQSSPWSACILSGEVFAVLACPALLNSTAAFERVPFGSKQEASVWLTNKPKDVTLRLRHGLRCCATKLI